MANPGEETEGKIANLEQAITGLCSIPDTQIIDISSYYESEPAYYEDQDAFANAVVLARTGRAAEGAFEVFACNREQPGTYARNRKWPRTLDLDIVDYQILRGQTDELTLPHPRVCERDFVVKPLLDFAEPCARRQHARCRRWRGIRKGTSYKLATCAKRSFIGISFAGCLWAWGVHANPMPAATSKTFPLNNVRFCPHGRWRARRCKAP